MKLSLIVAAAAASLLLGSVAVAHTVVYDAVLSSILPGSLGTGFAEVTVDYDLGTMDVEASFSGLTGTVTASHIHCCTVVAGVTTAGVATTTPTFPGFPLGGTSGTYSHVFNLLDAGSYNPAFVTANTNVNGAYAALGVGMDTDHAYFNIHTSAAPGGEIQGFLIAQAVPEASTSLMLGLGLIGLGGWARRRRG